MPKYLIRAYYSSDGIGGVADKGGSARRDVVEKLAAEVGGSMECFYFSWGDVDAYIIVDVPSEEKMAGIALAVNRSGAVKISTTPLLTVEQVDEAAGVSVGYSPPGH